MPSMTIKDATRVLVDQGTISNSVANVLENESRTYEVADVSNVDTDPVFSAFLIDESGSMEPYTDNVIMCQYELIKILRSSNVCKKDALFIVQWLFSDSAKAIHPFKKLSSTGNDDVILLNTGNYYKPHGNTALYKSLYYLLQELAANIAYAYNNAVVCTFTIGVITDGEDNIAGIHPSEIKNAIEEFQSKGILRSSVIVGLTNSNFTPEKLEELKERLGFQTAISLSQDPKEIRRAFVLASQSAVSGQTQKK